jgi:hypothetical protein
LSAGDHVINSKKVDPKKAKARHGKIFVGGLVPELTDEDIKNFFSQYGSVSSIFMSVSYLVFAIACCFLNFYVISDSGGGDAL